MASPFRGSISYTTHAADLDDAVVEWDRIVDAVEDITGVPVEGGAVEAMDPEDVVEGSPLDRAVRKANA